MIPPAAWSAGCPRCVAPNFICKLTKSHQSKSLGAAKVRSTLAKGKAMIGVLYQYHVWGIDNRGGGENKSTFRPMEICNTTTTRRKKNSVTSRLWCAMKQHVPTRFVFENWSLTCLNCFLQNRQQFFHVTDFLIV
jgi:hypothetical protein